MAAAIGTTGLTKDYGGGRGLFDLALEVAPGDVFGYLGPNGAGKSTTIRLLMGFIHATRGSASIFGLDAMRDTVEIKRFTGYLPAELPQFGSLRGRDIVGHFAALRGAVDQHRIKEICDRFELDLGLRFREYSTGNKRKLGIVLAFMHRPRLLILDEPSNGLDPLNQQQFYGLVDEAHADGATIFLSSHVLSEVEHVCRRVGIIRHGRLVKVAPLAELHEISTRRVEIEFAAPVDPEVFRRIPGVENLDSDGNRVTFSLRGSFEPVADALAGRHVVNLTSHEPTLEEAFLSYYSEQSQVVPA